MNEENKQKENITIYSLTHKAFPLPEDPLYRPLQVGAATHPDLGYLRDDQGENISEKNCYYSELTGHYWIWKNVKDQNIVGTCHYRRYLINEQEKILTREECLGLLKNCDLITTRPVELNNSYYDGFSANHNREALDAVGQAIGELYPQDGPLFWKLVKENKTYFGNMLICRKDLFDAYCSWLFPIFFLVEQRIDLETDADDYHRRVFGFISEFLLYVWARKLGLRVKECKVGMLGEKAETRAVKERLAQYVKDHDVEGGKAYFLQIHQKRPDILMEASDVTGELHLAMQILATAGEELRRTGHSFLEKEDEIKKLYPVFAEVNRRTIREKKLWQTKAVSEGSGMDLPEWVSPVAFQIAQQILTP